MTNVGTMLVRLLLDDSGVDKGVKHAQTSIRGFRAEIVDLARTVDDQLTNAFRQIGRAHV